MISNKAITLEQFQTTSSALTKEVDYIFLALENLLNWAKAQMNGIVVKPVTINAYELIADILKVYTELAKEKSINLINNVPPKLEFYCDRHHADLIIRNTLNNAVKFSNINSDIIIHSIVSKTNVQIIIQDQGVGISKDKINMLFSIEKHFSETGTKGEKGTGLGLLLCKEFIEKNGGSIQIESETNKGAKVILNFILHS
jgi:signal transduction histidine kinase